MDPLELPGNTLRRLTEGLDILFHNEFSVPARISEGQGAYRGKKGTLVWKGHMEYHLHKI